MGGFKMLELLDYRRRVAEMYAFIRSHGTHSPEAYARFVETRNFLFGTHPQSALSPEQKPTFTGLKYYDYDPAFRVVAKVMSLPEDERLTHMVDLGEGGDGQFSMTRFARVSFNLPTGSGTLSLYWINGYGGGVFLPFRDGTNTQTTYGGGRYLLDTIKGADLGADGDTHTLTLDFNYAYHPSCYYHYRWVCPLAQPENKLDFPIPVGEMMTDV